MRQIAIILAVLLLVSCSVKKRTYRDGYYIDWAFQKKKNTSLKQAGPVSSTRVEEKIPVQIVSAKPEEELLVSPKPHLLLLDTCGDVITFKSGDQVRAKVIEITDDKIKYKRCDNLDGPLFVVNKGNVALIRYVNGVEEKIEAPTPVYTPPSNNPQPQSPGNKTVAQRVHPNAWWALASVVLLWWIGIGFVLGLIFSALAIKRIKEDPKRWSGLKLAKTIQTICIIFIALLVLGLLLNL